MDPGAGRSPRIRPRKFFAGLLDELTVWAAHQFALEQPAGEGAQTSWRVVYEDSEARTGITPPELVAPPFPRAIEYIWIWFCELDQVRPGTMGANPISFQELDAWARRRGVDPDPFEIRCLLALDRVRLAELGKK